MSFSSDIAKFHKVAIDASLKVFQGSSLEILGSIIKRTPVDTGRLRSNWFTTLNNPAKITTDKTGLSTLGIANRIIKISKLSNAIYMVNNLPYVMVIENGSSKQAPAGMVKITIREWQRLVAKNAKAAR